MHDDLSSLTTMVFDTHRFTDQADAMERFVPSHRGKLIGWAERLIDKYHVVDAALSAEDLLQDTLLHCWQAIASGGITVIETPEQLAKVVRHKLNQEVLDERAREDARKRGGAGITHRNQQSAVRQADVDLDSINSHALPPDQEVIANECIERRLTRLDLHDPSLRAVAVRLADEFTHREIAHLLNMPLSAVHEKVRQIKIILAARETDLG
jgi:DNA-directed RNA polymerase specialized sigma24 family protein